MIANASNGAIHAVKAVYVNGRIMPQVIAADDVAGEVSYNPKDRHGNLMRVGDELAITTETGHVQFELYPGWGYDHFLRRFIIVRPH